MRAAGRSDLKSLRYDVHSESMRKKKMKLLTVAISLICLAPLSTFAQETARTEDASRVPTYELYSWQDSKDNWNFCMLYPTSRQKTVEEVFDQETTLHGVNQLKGRIAKLKKGSRIVWFDRLTWGGVRIKGSEGLKYPPKSFIKEVKSYAVARKIKLFYYDGPN